MTGSQSLIIYLSNDVFFTYFIVIQQKYLRLKRSTSDQTTGAGARQKQIKSILFFTKNYYKSMSDNYSKYPSQNLGLKYRLR